MFARNSRPLVLASLFSFVACGESVQSERASGRTEPLEIEDVAPPVDSELTTEADIKGVPIVSDHEGVSGVLPGDFPSDLPVHEPASIVDYGTAAGGQSYVELDSPSGLSLVLSDSRRRLSRAGWAVSGSIPNGLQARKSGVEVRITLSDSGGGTRIRIEYR